MKYSKKIAGDISTAAGILKITAHNARRALARPKSKYHVKLVHYLSLLIEARENLTKQK
jgi:hypothetical protein